MTIGIAQKDGRKCQEKGEIIVVALEIKDDFSLAPNI